MNVFDKGDILELRHTLTEQNARNDLSILYFVLSPKSFNKLGMTLVAPIAQGADIGRVQGFSVPLISTAASTKGTVLISGVRMIDLAVREVKYIERAPCEATEEASAILAAIIE